MKNLSNIKKHGKDHCSIKVGTLGSHNPRCLKSYKIRHPMKNFKNPKLPSFFSSLCIDYLHFLYYKIPYFGGFQKGGL